MPTLSELLNLPPEGYKRILEMSSLELEEYLGPITALEPEIKVPDIDLDNFEVNDEGEIKKKIKKASGGKKPGKQKVSDELFEKLIEGL